MTGPILVGPPDNKLLLEKSLGVIFYEEIRQWGPNRLLLVDTDNKEVTYGRFLQTSIKLAIKLKSSGLKRGDVITIISQNNWKYLATVVAGFFTGVTVNLLNHDYTSGELKHFLSICKPSFIFCTTKSVNNLLALKEETFHFGNIILYDGETTENATTFDDFLNKANNDTTFIPTDSKPNEEVALILTSSGTTGFPKCVQLTHTNVKTTMMYCKDPYFIDINEKECLIGFLPFFHIFGIAIGLSSILFGAKLVIIEKFSPDRFLTSIQEHKITKLFVVPPILIFLVKSPLVQKYDLSSIKDIFSGAAPVAKELEEAAEKQLNIESVRQIYGMTETCGAVTIMPKDARKRGSSGRLIHTFSAKVCDIQTGKAMSANETGELRFKGDGVMKGFLGKEKETEDSFDDEGFLKSGDLGYYDDEGYFYIVDRLKEIIKCKGFQVSPAELESLLIQHPSVRDAGVVAKPDEKVGEAPVAFVVKQPNVNVTEEELISYIAENLSVQKHLYGGVRFIEEIPKNPSGKILRKNLKEMLENEQ